MTLCVHYIQDVSVDYRQHDVTSACNNQTMARVITVQIMIDAFQLCGIDQLPTRLSVNVLFASATVYFIIIIFSCS